jgi:hypothetical protein
MATHRTQHNCFKIFQHASHFHESDHRLRNTVPADRPNQVPLIAHPSMVLSVFASELYLKCLLCLETGKVPQTHNLKTLFDALKPETKRRLEELWDADVRKPQRQKVLDHVRTFPEGDKLRIDLPSVLELGANAFQELRYLYEAGQSFFLLSDFPNLLRAVTLERMPWWRAILPAPPIRHG